MSRFRAREICVVRRSQLIRWPNYEQHSAFLGRHVVMGGGSREQKLAGKSKAQAQAVLDEFLIPGTL
jgi:hypothetical protein